MQENRPFRALFVHFLILGKMTAYQNLRRVIDAMEDVEATWVPIELSTPEWWSRIPPVSLSHSLRFGLVARSRVLALESARGRFDAAFFNHVLPTLFLHGFRKRTPSIDALDVTPLDLVRYGQLYYDGGRSQGIAPVRSMKHWYAKRVFGEAALLLPQSEFTGRSLLRDYGIPAEKQLVLDPGVILREIHRKPVREGNPVRILFVGGDFIRKGGDLVLRVAQRPEFSGCEFHIVTRDDPGSLGTNVVVHAGVENNSARLFELYSDADVFVMPTRADFAPTNVICEAMAMGLPVITTNICGLDEFVRNGLNGFAIPVDDEAALAAALRAIVHDTALRRRFSEHARKMAEKFFDVERNAHKLVALLKQAAVQRAHHHSSTEQHGRKNGI